MMPRQSKHLGRADNLSRTVIKTQRQKRETHERKGAKEKANAIAKREGGAPPGARWEKSNGPHGE